MDWQVVIMGDTGASNFVGGLIICTLFIAVPIFSLLFFICWRSRLGTLKPIILSLLGIVLIPCLLMVSMIVYDVAKRNYESYVGARQTIILTFGGITYKLQPQKASGAELLPDGTNVYHGDPISFTEKDGILTVNGQIIAKVKSGDIVEIDNTGSTLIRHQTQPAK